MTLPSKVRRNPAPPRESPPPPDVRPVAKAKKGRGRQAVSSSASSATPLSPPTKESQIKKDLDPVPVKVKTEEVREEIASQPVEPTSEAPTDSSHGDLAATVATAPLQSNAAAGSAAAEPDVPTFDASVALFSLDSFLASLFSLAPSISDEDKASILHTVEASGGTCLSWSALLAVVNVANFAEQTYLAQLKLEVLYKSYYSTLSRTNEKFIAYCQRLLDLIQEKDWIVDLVTVRAFALKFATIRRQFDQIRDNLDNILLHDAKEEFNRVKKKHHTTVSKRTQRRFRAWYVDHLEKPYPTEDEKLLMAFCCDVSVKQVNTWFGNHRGRTKRKLEEMTPAFKVDAEHGVVVLLVPASSQSGKNGTKRRKLSGEDEADADADADAEEAKSKPKAKGKTEAGFLEVVIPMNEVRLPATPRTMPVSVKEDIWAAIKLEGEDRFDSEEFLDSTPIALRRERRKTASKFLDSVKVDQEASDSEEETPKKRRPKDENYEAPSDADDSNSDYNSCDDSE